jgi:hypothetical protein
VNRNEAKLSGERRGAGKQRWREVGGISRLSSYRLISGFLFRLLNMRLDCGANRAAADDLAKGTERTEFRGGVQVGSTMVLNLADPGNFTMVVKDLGRKEVDFTREQHAHKQGAHPILVPIFSPASHLEGFALTWFGFKLSAQPCLLSIIPNNLPTEEYLICRCLSYRNRDARPLWEVA